MTCGVSSVPYRSGFDATTIVLVLSGFLLASRLRIRCSVALLSHDCATKTASRPNSTAKAIITMVLVRTRLPRLTPLSLAVFLAINIEVRWYRIGEVLCANFAMLKIG